MFGHFRPRVSPAEWCVGVPTEHGAQSWATVVTARFYRILFFFSSRSSVARLGSARAFVTRPSARSHHPLPINIIALEAEQQIDRIAPIDITPSHPLHPRRCSKSGVTPSSAYDWNDAGTPTDADQVGTPRPTFGLRACLTYNAQTTGINLLGARRG